MKFRAAFIFAGSVLASCLMASAQTPPDAAYIKASFEKPAGKFELVQGLEEISGLAAGPDNTVFAHNDEYGIVYQVSLDNGKVLAAFALGKPTVERDFEGIEVFDGRVYLLTSAGRIYEGVIGAHKTRVKYNAYDTGAGDFCETEGLTLGPPDDDGGATFLILCKKAKTAKSSDQIQQNTRIRIYRWSLNRRLPVQSPWLETARKDVTDGDPKNFNPSGFSWSQAHKQLFIVSAKAQRYASLRADGTVLQKAKLPPENHPQAEGITLTNAGELIIADEGQRNTAPSLTVYGGVEVGR